MEANTPWLTRTRAKMEPCMAKPPLLGICVLILEDDFWQAQDSRDRLSEAGAEVVAMTGSIPEALASLTARPCDIGLLDINLVGLQSFDLAREILRRGVPVLFLTGYEPAMLPSDLTDVPLITKPFEWPVVIARIVKMLGKTDKMPMDAGGPQN